MIATTIPPAAQTDTSAPVIDEQLAGLLAAWESAVERLQRTHETLRAEVARLTDELKQKNRELARKQRLAELGQMAAHIAHEVRNELTPITVYLGMLDRRLTQAPAERDIVQRISGSFRSLDSTVSDLLQFAREGTAVRHDTPVAPLIQDVLETLRPQLDGHGVATEVDVSAGLTAKVDSALLRRAVLNLAINAIDAMPSGGALSMYAGATPGGGVEIEVADSGAGLSDASLSRMFEPFFTTKSDGTGLGLAMVYRIAEVHGGAVVARNCPEGGAAITISLPAASNP